MMNDKVKSVFKKIFYFIFAVSVVVNCLLIFAVTRKSAECDSLKSDVESIRTTVNDTQAALGIAVDSSKGLTEQIQQIGDLLKKERETSSGIASTSSSIEQSGKDLAATAGGIREETEGFGESIAEAIRITDELKRREDSGTVGTGE